MAGWIVVLCEVRRGSTTDTIEPLAPIYLDRIVREGDSIFEVNENQSRTGRRWLRSEHWCLFSRGRCECGGELTADQNHPELRRDDPLHLALQVTCNYGREAWLSATQSTLPI